MQLLALNSLKLLKTLNKNDIERIKQLIKENEEFLEGKKQQTNLLRELSDLIQLTKKITEKIREFLSKKEARGNLFKKVFRKLQS
ncbi:MAG: hypothetical protein D3924_20860, partial [Candidatus Electrothrix sp. AR4]|nr:hypothetical protein [Candidatus Electrothrix sp. AR4]